MRARDRVPAMPDVFSRAKRSEVMSLIRSLTG